MKKIILNNIKFYQEEVAKINEKAQIVAVSKTIEPVYVNFATNNGLNTIGENRVQEYLSKKDEYSCKNIHFIGHLQSNKVKNIIESVNLIQSVDSINLASTINSYAEKLGIIQEILVQINISSEDSKSGIDTDSVSEFIAKIQTFNNIKIRGFMTIPKNTVDYELETYFDKMNEIFTSYENFDILSMGMSNDFRLALKHGSTMIRVGSGIFKGPHPE